MANQTEPCLKVREQVVLTAPGKILVERYLTAKGKKMITLAKTRKDKDAIWAKYGKNRYRIDPDAKPCRNKTGGVLIIKHYTS
jgi:hypothetical protein